MTEGPFQGEPAPQFSQPFSGCQPHPNGPSQTAAGSKRKSSSPADPLFQDTGYDADVEVVKPYEIEEPDDDFASESPRSRTPRFLEGPDKWQKELVHSMRGLHCDSDTNSSQLRMGPKRGQKRKPSNSPAGGWAPVQSRPSSRHGETTILSPKRLRRWSKRSREDLRSVRAASSLHIASETSPYRSSSATRRSTDASGIEPMKGIIAADTDEMDTD